MFATIKGWFGYGPRATEAPPTQTELTHDAAVEELEQVRAQILTAKIQVEQVVTRLARVADEESVLYARREQIIMECHDAYLHPQLDGLPAATTTAEDEDISDDDSSSDLAADDNAAFQRSELSEDLQQLRQRRAARMARFRRRTQQEDGVIPTPSSAPQTPESVQACYNVLVSRREAIGASFENIMAKLRHNRETLDTAVIRLEIELTRLEADERYLARAVREMDRAEWREDMSEEARQRREAREARRRLVHVAGNSYTISRDNETSSSSEDDVCAIEVKGSPLNGLPTGSPQRTSVQPVAATPATVAVQRKGRQGAPSGAPRRQLHLDEREMSDREEEDDDGEDLSDEAIRREVERLRRSGDAAPPLRSIVTV